MSTFVPLILKNSIKVKEISKQGDTIVSFRTLAWPNLVEIKYFSNFVQDFIH